MAEPSVVLVWGEHEYLVAEAARAIVDGRGLRASEVAAAEWRGGELSDLSTPSLWGERRALIVSGCQRLPDAAGREIAQYLRSPAEDAVCVFTMVSAAANPPLAKAVRAAGGATKQITIRRQDLPRWVQDRARMLGVRVNGAACSALVDVVGEDPAALARAVEQLGAAFAGRPIGPAEVHAQFRGLGDQRVWDLCDHAFAGRVGEALVTLRGLLAGGHDPLLVLGGIASRVRDLLRVRSLPDRLPAADAARRAGLRYEWQLRRYRDQAGRFSVEELVSLHRRVTEADRALKGGVPGEVMLGGLVAAMAGQPAAALDVDIRVSR
jgi:DNA polymerase-3 subunit delta